MSHYPDLFALLGADADARSYYDSLSASLRDALRRQNVASFAELQSVVADERETV